VLRTRLSGEQTFRQLLGRVREATVRAFEHQEVPFEKLVEELRPERDPGRHPLFQVMLSLHNVQVPQFSLPGLTVTPLEVELGTAKFDLLLNMREEGGGLKAMLEYNADLFDGAQAARMLDHLGLLLGEAAARPDAPLSLLGRAVAEDEERRRGSEQAGLEEARLLKYRGARRKVAGAAPLRQEEVL
jgi:non-ribosomal peptide synthetase component F